MIEDFGDKVQYIIKEVADGDFINISIEDLKNKPEYTNNKVYKSQADAAKELNLYTSNLNEVLKRKRKTVKGYKFIYHNQQCPK